MGHEHNTYRQYFKTKKEADDVLEKLHELRNHRENGTLHLADLLIYSGKEPSDWHKDYEIVNLDHAYVEKITSYVGKGKRTQYTVRVYTHLE